MKKTFEISELKYHKTITLRLLKEDGTNEETDIDVKINSKDLDTVYDLYSEMSKYEVGENFEITGEILEKSKQIEAVVYGTFLEKAQSSFTKVDLDVLTSKIIVDIIGETGIANQKDIVNQNKTYQKKMPRIKK